MISEPTDNLMKADPHDDPMWSVLADLRDNRRSHIALVAADDQAMRTAAMKRLREHINGRYAIFDFDYATTDILSLGRYCRSLPADKPACVFAFGLENLKILDREKYQSALQFLNSHREDIQLSKTQVVVWLTSDTQNDVLWQAPDFADWSTARINLSLAEEAEEVTRKIERYEKMLARPKVEPAMVREYERQLTLLRDRREQFKLNASPRGLDIVYDLFLSHASEDKPWCETLAERLRDEGVRVWFDAWELQPGDNLIARINEGLKRSRKMVAVFSQNYFKDSKVWTRAESYAQLSPDILSKDRPLIPLLIEDCEIEPTLRGILHLDFRNPDDFDLRLRDLINALDRPRRESAREEPVEFREHRLDPVEGGRRGIPKGKRFADEVAALYRLLGFDVKQDVEIGGFPVGLAIEQRIGGAAMQFIVECEDKRITPAERDRMLARQNLARIKLPRHRWIAVSSQGFDAEARATLEEAGVDCTTYADLLRDLVPLEEYVEGLIEEYDRWRTDNWRGEDWFVRPDLRRDITGEDLPALKYIGDWLGNSNQNQLVVLGDAGSGKSTLVRFLVDNLARRHREDPVRHPAPLLVPLGEVRKETTLEAIVHEHFSRRNFALPNFRRFEHLVRMGKIVLFFDAFDEMVDRVSFEEGFQNFREISRVADAEAKIVVTCRVNYFKDVDEQQEIIEDAFRAAGTAYYKSLRERQGAEVVYLKPFDEAKIRRYLAVARPRPEEDWAKIEQVYDLKGLAQLPLLMAMITESLDKFAPGERVDAAKLYERYTDDWIARENKIGVRFTMRKGDKLRSMQEMAWRLWNHPDRPMRYRELISFVEEMKSADVGELRGHEPEDLAAAIHLRSFLRREGESAFTFIHRSFMEYFLARRLYQALADARATDTTSVAGGRVSSPTVKEGLVSESALADAQATDTAALLNTRRFNKRIIHFLTMMDTGDRIVEPLQAILTAAYRPNVSENALEMLYWGGRIRCEMEEEIGDEAQLRRTLAARLPRGAQLAHAQLPGVALECADLGEADLGEADLSGAMLNRALLSGARLKGAALAGAQLQQAEAARADFREAALRGASFLSANLRGADFTDADYDPESFKDADLSGVKGLSGVSAGVDLARLQPVVQSGTNFAVYAISYNYDGTLMAAAGQDGVIRLYRVADGALLRTLEGHTSNVWSVAFSPDGQQLASGSYDNTIRIWQINSGKTLRTLEGHTSNVRSVAFSPDGEQLASGSYDNTIRIWQINSGKTLRTLEGHTNWVRSVAFSPDGQQLASGSSDKTIRLWQINSGKTLRTLEGHTSNVWSVAFSPDGQQLASGSNDNTIRLWRINSGKTLRTLEGHTSNVWSVAFSPDGEQLASGSSDNTIRLWQINSGKTLRRLEGHTSDVGSVAFSPDGEQLASGSSDKTIRLWQINSGKMLRTLEGHTDSVRSVAFSPDGEQLASGSYDNTIRIWQINSGKTLRTLEGHTNWVRSVAFSPDGQQLASGSSDKTIRLWQINSGKTLRTLEGHTSDVGSVAFSPDGEQLASGSSDKTIRLWQINSGKTLRTLEGHTSNVWSVAFSPDGEQLASGSSDNTIRLWQINSGKTLRRLEGHTSDVGSVAFSPDGEQLASGSSDKTIRLWQINSGKTLRTLEGHTSYVLSVAFSPDGEQLASGSDDQTIRLWQINSGKTLRTLRGHLGPIYAVGFAPNGRYLIGAGGVGRLQFWDHQTGETILYRHAFGPGLWLDLLPDGRFDAAPDALRYLGYTEIEGFAHYPAEALVKEFYSPDAVAEVLAKYTK